MNDQQKALELAAYIKEGRTHPLLSNEEDAFLVRVLEVFAGCDCQCPEPETGAALVSESCPIHSGHFRPITTVL